MPVRLEMKLLSEMKKEMKKFNLVIMGCLLINTFSYGQETEISNILSKLSEIRDQYGNNFNPNEANKGLTLILVEGTNNSFGEIYAKFKGKKLAENVLVVAGWKDVMPDTEYNSKYKHMSDGFKSDEGLGKDGYSILFDLNSESLKLFRIEGRYAMANVDPDRNQMKIENFGSDRIEFLNAIRKFFN